jgi:SAM-dependent methyltransferase
MKIRARDVSAYPFRRRGRLLDVGCGTGQLLAVWSVQQDSCVGVEPSREVAVAARERTGLDIRPGTLFDHEFPPESFDVVTISHVLEHVPDARALLRRVSNLLRRAESPRLGAELRKPPQALDGAGVPLEIRAISGTSGRRGRRAAREAGLGPSRSRPKRMNGSTVKRRGAGRPLAGDPRPALGPDPGHDPVPAFPPGGRIQTPRPQGQPEGAVNGVPQSRGDRRSFPVI